MKFKEQLKRFLPEYKTNPFRVQITPHEKFFAFGGWAPVGMDHDEVHDLTYTVYKHALGKWKTTPIIFKAKAKDEDGFAPMDTFYVGKYAKDIDQKVEEGGLAELITPDEWNACLVYYTQECARMENAFKRNPIQQKIDALHSLAGMGRLEKKEQDQMTLFYQEQLRKDPEYKALEELKKDLIVLHTYVLSRQKEKTKERRKDLKTLLQGLRTDYNSQEMRKIIPNSKRRMETRARMRKELEKDKSAGL